jgi:hypothetical protein
LQRSIGGFSGEALPARLSALRATGTIPAITAVHFRPGFIDVDGSSIKLPSVQSGDRFLGLTVLRHLDESKASGPACIAIRYDADTLNGSVGFKQGANGFFRGSKTEVSYKYVFHSFPRFDGAANGQTEN